jgi:aminobenzoyl-glutamate utilization protein B
MKVSRLVAIATLLVAPLATASSQAAVADPRLDRLKTEALTAVEGRSKMVQEIVDMLFSFGELGFQEFETSKYLTGILEQNGFKVERGVAGIPTAWVAKWGSGKPVISLGSDIDGIPQANQKPAVGYREAQIPFAPGSRGRTQQRPGREHRRGPGGQADHGT